MVKDLIPIENLEIICEVAYRPNDQPAQFYVIVKDKSEKEIFYISKGLAAIIRPYEHANTAHFRIIDNQELTKRILTEGKRDPEIYIETKRKLA